MIHFLSFHILLTPKIREECRECICKPLVYNTISKELVFFKKHAPINKFKPELVALLYQPQSDLATEKGMRRAVIVQAAEKTNGQVEKNLSIPLFL